MSKEAIMMEQATCLRLLNQGKTRKEICEITGLGYEQVRRRINGAKKAERLDPALRDMLYDKGIVDLAGLHSGWLLEKDSSGSGHSLYFYLGPDQEKISFVDAVMEVLQDIPKLDPVVKVFDHDGTGYANFVCLADLHVGGDYGAAYLEEDFNTAIDDLVNRMPPAEKAFLMELGDLLDANDHKGVTPASGNPVDVKRENHLQNTMQAIKLMRRAAYHLLETHQELEIHLIEGNHDRTAYIAVLLALAEHFADNPRVTVFIPEFDEENPITADYRVVTWGDCAMFPHHGDGIKWGDLKDVWAEVYPDAWAAAKSHRCIATAHFHHDRKRELIGCVGEHFRTLHRPNRWARGKGMISRGSLAALTWHKERGEEYRTISNIRPVYARSHK